MSQRAELHITSGLGSIQQSFGSIDEFIETLKGGLLADMDGLDPKRLNILNVGGEYLNTSTNNASTDTSIVSPTGDHRTRIDFEVARGAEGEPTAGQVMKHLAERIFDMNGNLTSGRLEEALGGLAMVVVEGSKSSSLNRTAGFEHAHSFKDPSSWVKPRDDDDNDDDDGKKDEKHSDEKHSDKHVDEKHKEKEKHASEGNGTTQWYPWQWFRWFYGKKKGAAQMSAVPWTALPILLAFCVTTESSS